MRETKAIKIPRSVVVTERLVLIQLGFQVDPPSQETEDAGNGSAHEGGDTLTIGLPYGWSYKEDPGLGRTTRLFDPQHRERAAYSANGMRVYSDGVSRRYASVIIHTRYAVHEIGTQLPGPRLIRRLGVTDRSTRQPLYTCQIPVIHGVEWRWDWAHSEAERWLDAHFPEWKNPVAYWNTPEAQ